jgi:hypothetical protein
VAYHVLNTELCDRMLDVAAWFLVPQRQMPQERIEIEIRSAGHRY